MNLTSDLRARVFRSAKLIADSYFRPPYRDATVASRRFASRIVRSPESDFVFTDLGMRLDPATVGTDEELAQALEGVWEQAAAEFDPGVDVSA